MCGIANNIWLEKSHLPFLPEYRVKFVPVVYIYFHNRTRRVNAPKTDIKRLSRRAVNNRKG
jgi:hypothetical protein